MPWLVRVTLLCALACAVGVISPAHGDPDRTSPSQRADSSSLRHLPTLNRVVRHFDFEEANEAPYEMPLNFYRYGGEDGATAQGFPPFGTMRLSEAHAASGRWSFEFSLNGGSLAARVPTAVIPVVPLADYAVTTRVRTEGLTHARARLVAWFHDRQGRMIESSRSTSELVKTDGTWMTLSVELRGEYEHAADLVLELQLLQPRQFLADATSSDGPMLEDVHGRAWFDDVTVWHAPRIEINMPHPGHVVPVGESAEISLLVRDLTHESLSARLQVFNITGELVYDEQFTTPRALRQRTVKLPSLAYGWYRAVLEVQGQGNLIGQRWLDFVMASPPLQRQREAATHFGVVLPEAWYASPSNIPAMVEHLHGRHLVVPVWAMNDVSYDSEAHLQQRHAALVAFADLRQELTFAIHRVPEDIAVELDVAPEEVLKALTRDVSAWRPYLSSLLRSGVEVDHWQLGSMLHESNGSLQHRINDARKNMQQLVSVPSLVLPLEAAQRTAEQLRVDRRQMMVSHEVRSDALPEYVEQWRTGRSPIVLHLRSTPESLYHPLQQMDDLALRVLYALRSGIDQLLIDAPWEMAESGQHSPQPAMAMWRQLAQHLGNRQFVGELNLGPALSCWLFQGQQPGDDLLVAWSHEIGNSTTPMNMQLTDRAVDVYDLFGNVQTIAFRDGTHKIDVTPSPIFVEGINLPLVQFRGGFALDPPLVPSENRTHRHEIVLHNPWDVQLSGTLVLQEKANWRMTPRSHDFTIEANGTARLPVEIILDRSVPTGASTLHADVLLQADGNYRVSLWTEVEVGLSSMDFALTWSVRENADTGQEDLIITQFITNTGSEPLFADAFLFAPGVQQQRRLIAGLEPGEVAVRTFVVPDGIQQLAGQIVRVTVASRSGPGRLNRELHIPAQRGGFVVTAPIESAGNE